MADTRGLLIYDGTCGSCRSSVGWVLRHQRSDSHFSVVSSQELSDRELAQRSLTRGDVERFVCWIEAGRAERGSRAVARVLLRVKGAWPLLGSALLVPPLSLVAPVVYRVVARYRHRIPGATSQCGRAGAVGRTQLSHQKETTQSTLGRDGHRDAGVL